MILIKYSFSRCSIGIISSQDDADVFDNKVVATRGTAQIIVKSSVFASAFSNTMAFLLRRVDTLDPRAGRKCGKYSNQSNMSDAVWQV